MTSTPRGERRFASKSANVVVAARKLRLRKERIATNTCVADGPQAVEYGLRASLVKRLFVDPVGGERFAGLIADALGQGVEVVDVDSATMSSLTETQSPQGILGVAKIPDLGESITTAAAMNVLLLEAAQDPGNVGTIIRTADAAGVDYVVLGPGSADPYSAKCVRSSAGSVFGVPVLQVADVSEAIAEAQREGLVVRGTAGEAALTLHGPDGPQLDAPTMWVMGNEARGLSADIAAACDELVAIPMFGANESLNVAVAAALCMYATALAQRGSQSDGVRVT